MKDTGHSGLMWVLAFLCVGLLLFGVMGSSVLLLWPLACIGMMLAMWWAMRGGHAKPSDEADVGLRDRAHSR